MKTLTNLEYQTFKTDVIEQQPIRRKCSLSDLKISSLDEVEYAGLSLVLSTRALKDLIRLIGFTSGQQDKMKSAAGLNVTLSILNSLRSIMSTHKGEITLNISPNRVITSITSSDRQTLSPVTFFETYERIANDSNLNIRHVSFNSDTGAASISAVAANSVQIGTYKDEFFRSGLSTSITANGIQVDPFMERMVCTNGMIARSFEESFKLSSSTQSAWEEFYKHIERLEKYNYVPSRFTSAVDRSQSLASSLAELERSCQLITSTSKCSKDELEIFFKGLRDTQIQYAKAGIDIDQLTQDQKRNCKTGVTHWSLINGLTDFASHDYGYELEPTSARHVMAVAGDMLAKGPDSHNLVLNQPY